MPKIKMLFQENRDAETIHTYVDASQKWNTKYTWLAIPNKQPPHFSAIFESLTKKLTKKLSL